MTAGVAGGVAGAVVVVKVWFRRDPTCSSCDCRSDGSTSCGGGGNLERENVEAVVCAPLDSTSSADEAGVEWKCVDVGESVRFTAARRQRVNTADDRAKHRCCALLHDRQANFLLAREQIDPQG